MEEQDKAKAKPIAKPGREARLAQALRANLKRRKAPKPAPAPPEPRK